MRLSQLAFLRDCNPNIPWEKSHWDNTVVKSEEKKEKRLLQDNCHFLSGSQTSPFSWTSLGGDDGGGDDNDNNNDYGLDDDGSLVDNDDGSDGDVYDNCPFVTC